MADGTTATKQATATKQEYTAKRKLPSCLVTVTRVQDLESFILTAAERVSGAKPADIRFKIEISEQGDSAQEIAHMADYDRRIFPDEIESVNLNLTAYGDKPLRINLRIHREQLHSTLEVKVTGERCREQAVALCTEIIGIIKQGATAAWFFRPSPTTEIVSGILAPLVFGFCALGFTRVGEWYFTIPALVVLLGWTFYLVSRVLRPYTIFESRKDERLSKTAEWLNWGFGSFVLFTIVLGTAVTAIRRVILGF